MCALSPVMSRLLCLGSRPLAAQQGFKSGSPVPSAMRETWVWSLGWENPLEKGKATHFSILAWRIPWIQSIGSQRVGHDWVTFTYLPQSLQSRLLCEELITHVGRTICPLQGHAGNTSTSLIYYSPFLPLPSRSKYRAWPPIISQEGPGDHRKALNWGTPS